MVILRVVLLLLPPIILHKNRTLNDYLGGVMDSLDGSHGPSFTYLPIIYEDDCRVASCRTQFVKSEEERYILLVVLLPAAA